MASNLRPAARQAVRLSFNTLRTESRAGFPSQSRIQQAFFGRAATCLYQQRGSRRQYATQPPPSDDKLSSIGKEKTPANSSSKSDSSASEPLLEGRVHLSEEEYGTLSKIITNVPANMRTEIKEQEVIQTLKKVGAPIELQRILHKYKHGSFGLGDAMDVMRAMSKTSNIVAEEHVAAMRNQGEQQEAKSSKEPGPIDQKDSSKGSSQTGFSSNDQGSGNKNNGKKPEPNSNREMLTWLASSVLFYLIFTSLYPSESSKDITWQELRKNYLDKGLVERFVIADNRVRVDLNREAVQSMYPDNVASGPGFHFYFTIGSAEAFEKRLDDAQAELAIPSADRIPVSYQRPSALGALFYSFGPTILIIGLLYYMSRRAGGGMGRGGGGVFGMGKSKAKMYNHDSAVKVKFTDVAGMDEAKQEIMEFVGFLKSPDKFIKLGAKIPRGAILSGPPGTGKTLLAKATAGESGVPFFSVSGSEFVEMFVGVGASRVRDLFSNARKNAPCIIFIDEIDAIGRARGESSRFGGNDEREATLNQILTEMDGFNTTEQVVVLAGTNRPDVLDKALMRPGRFDRQIHIDRPTIAGRVDIFKVYLKKVKTDEEMDHLAGRLAALTPGFAGADIANVVNEAALVAARVNADSITLAHFEQAIERVVGGLERKSLVLNPEERKTVAYHEAGHAICGWYFEYADPLLKVSIIPRGKGALGYAQYLPTGDAYLMNTRQLMDRMAMTLGGRISEELHFPTVTTGASDDFKKVTSMATTMVTQWGMSEKLGPIHFDANSSENQFTKPFAESTAQTIDAEVKRIVGEAYTQCKTLLTEKKKEIGLVAEELLSKEMLTRDDMVRLLGKRPFKDKDEFTKYFNDDQPGQSGGPPSAPKAEPVVEAPGGDAQEPGPGVMGPAAPAFWGKEERRL